MIRGASRRGRSPAVSRVPDAEKQTLKKAAESAAAMLVQLEKQRERIDERIAKLQRVIEAWDSLSGRRKPPARVATEPTIQDQPRVRRGQVGKHIDAVLADGREFDERELLDQITRRFGVIYNRGTVYS